MQFQLNEILAPTVRELFVREIETLIISGKFKKGDRLPTEREMAKQMKVSKTIINAGINELSRKGFVEIVPRKGVFVAEYNKYGLPDILIPIMEFNGGKYSLETINSLIEFRVCIESECAYLAAKNRTLQDIETLEALLLQFASSETNLDIAIVAFEIHQSIACATGNNIYPLVYNSFKKVHINFTENTLQYYKVEYAQSSLAHVIHAIKIQDAELARATMHDLINSFAKELLNTYFKTTKE